MAAQPRLYRVEIADGQWGVAVDGVPTIFAGTREEALDLARLAVATDLENGRKAELDDQSASRSKRQRSEEKSQSIIDLGKPHIAKFWAERLGVTVGELQAAVDQVGYRAADVARALGRIWPVNF